MGEASIENGELVLDFRPPNPGRIRVGLLGVVSKDYEVTVSVKIVELRFPPIIANGVKIGLRAHAIDENWKIPLLQYSLSYNFFLGRHTDGRKGIGASIWYVHKIVKLPKMDAELRNKLLEFSPFAFEMNKWYRLKVIARDNRFQVFVDKKKAHVKKACNRNRVFVGVGSPNPYYGRGDPAPTISLRILHFLFI